jgi:hypothetical protein
MSGERVEFSRCERLDLRVGHWTLTARPVAVLVLFVAVHLLEIVAAGFFTRVRSMITGKESVAVHTEITR